MPALQAPHSLAAARDDRAPNGGFSLRLNGKLELDGRFRVENNKLILTDKDGRTQLGDTITITRLTANVLVLTSATKKSSAFVRK